MSREEKRQRFTLTIFLSVIIFAIQFLAIIISGVFIYILIEKGIITIGKEPALTSRYLLVYMGLISLAIGAIGSAVSSKMTLRRLTESFLN